MGELAMNGSSRDANLGDLFRGEEVGNYNRTDLGKVQMFYFTAILLAVYGIALANQLFEPVAVTEFPDLDQSMIALLAISHAGYLSYKAVPKSKG